MQSRSEISFLSTSLSALCELPGGCRRAALLGLIKFYMTSAEHIVSSGEDRLSYTDERVRNSQLKPTHVQLAILTSSSCPPLQGVRTIGDDARRFHVCLNGARHIRGDERAPRSCPSKDRTWHCM